MEDTASSGEGGERYEAVHASNADGDAWQPLIDPRRFFDAIGRFKYLIGATTLAGAAIGVMVALSTPKLYYSSSEMLVDPRDLKLLDRELTPSTLPYDASLAIVENQLRILTSQSVMLKLVDELNLDEDPEFNGEGGPQNAIGTLLDILMPGDAAQNEATRRAAAMDTLYHRVGANRGEKSFVFNVYAGSEDPQKAALIANTLTRIFVDFQNTLQTDTAVQANEELSSRLESLRGDVEKAERQVEEFRAQSDLVDAQGKLIADEEILRLNEQLTAARAQTISLNARADSVRSLNAEAIIRDGLPEGMTSGTLVTLRSQYSAATQNVNRLSAKLGPRHPELQAARQQAEGIASEIATEIRRIIGGIQADLRRAVQTEQDLAARLAQLKARRSDAGDDIVKLRELEREAAARRAVYEAFLLRARETGEQSNISTANIKVISEALPAINPSGTSRKLIAIGGTLAGFLAGVAIAALAALIDSLKNREPAQRRPIEPRPERASVRRESGKSVRPPVREQEGIREPALAAPEPAPAAQHVPQPQHYVAQPPAWPVAQPVYWPQQMPVMAPAYPWMQPAMQPVMAPMAAYAAPPFQPAAVQPEPFRPAPATQAAPEAGRFPHGADRVSDDVTDDIEALRRRIRSVRKVMDQLTGDRSSHH